MKVIEWNINHRLNYSKLNMPEWVATVIKESHADVAVLTECCDRVPNWITEKAKAFPKENYYLFSSNNNQANNNDVVIAGIRIHAMNIKDEEKKHNYNQY